MALALNDRVQQQGTANTTVSFTLTSTVPGFQTFAVIGNGNTTYYTATDASYNWEVGIGTYSTTGPTLTRTTILSSSNSGSAVTFVGDVTVFVTYPAEKSINYDANGVATIGELLGYADTGIIGSFASTVAGYNQVVLQNKSTATNASSNFNVSNDAGTAGSNYAELGINSSTFSNGAGCFNIPGAAYVASAGEDLSIGTYGPHSIHFATNSNTTDSMTIYDDGGISLGGFGEPGLGSMAGNRFVPGFESITSAAGITVLTNSSTYYQRVVGTATQTIQMPDATTCLVGTTFIIENGSTVDINITDGATVILDTIAPGSITYIYAIANVTVAGTWERYHFLPNSYDFATSIANFGTATIINALWNGTTIGTAYGGTGLTTFSAANNALYSTSAGALAAGTLPVAAGGTGTTTLTGIPYANGTSAYTAATTAQALTLIGTVPIANGGTNSTATATAGGVGYGTGTAHAYTVAGTAGQILQSNGASAPSWIANTVGTVTSVTGTAPVVSSGGATPAISMAAATTSVSGYLTSTDWNTFNGKQAAGSYVTVGGALGTPSSGTLTNCTFPTLNQNTTGSSGSCTGNSATATNATTAANLSTAAPIYRTASGAGYLNGQYPTYESTGTSGAIYSIGGSYVPGTTTLGNMYGIGYGYSGNAGITATGAPISNWGMYVASAGVSRIFLSSDSGIGYFNGAIYSAGTQCVTNTGSWGISVTGSSASCTGNAATATTAGGLTGTPAITVGAIGCTTITASGAITSTGNVTAFFSDDRLKTRHGKIENALEKLQTLDGFYYTPNQVAQDLGYEAIQDVGVSAQSVQAILPEIVAPAPIDDKYLTVRYEKLVPLLIEAIKELTAKVEALEAR